MYCVFNKRKRTNKMLIYVEINLCTTSNGSRVFLWTVWKTAVLYFLPVYAKLIHPRFVQSLDCTLSEGQPESHVISRGLGLDHERAPRLSEYADFLLKAQLTHLQIGFICGSERANQFKGISNTELKMRTLISLPLLYNQLMCPSRGLVIRRRLGQWRSAVV